jgi:hypothetical protein
VPVRTGDIVGPRRADDLCAQQVGLGGAAGPGGAADGDHGDGGLDEVLGHRGQQCQQRRGRVAARNRDAARAAQPLARAGQLRQSVGPAAGVRRSVEPLPRVGVGEAEVGAAVDDQRVGAELFGQRGRMTMRQRQEHHVVAGEHVELGRLDHALGQRRQVRVVLTEGAAGAGGRGHRADREAPVRVGRVPEQQA